MARARTLVVDDHPLFRLGLHALLRNDYHIELVGEATSLDEAVEVARRVPLDLAIVDVVLPGGGVAVTAQLHALQPSCKILGVSAIDEPIRIVAMLRAGATGYALKTQAVDDIATALRLVLGGVRYLPPGISEAEVDALLADDRRPFERLTKREREIFERLVLGESNGAIATALFISMRTVETHRQRILNKLGAHSIVELLHVATRYGLT